MKRIRFKFLCLALSSLVGSAAVTAQTSYDWKNVQINGGGFVSGVVFSKAAKDLVYARTDVGGAYRWDNAAQLWIPLTDQFTADQSNYTGILSIAADPSDSNRVYAAAGLYTPSWAGNAAVLSSSNKGASWTVNQLPVKLGGNEDGRQAGERLQVDPNANNILYLGTSKDGLWKSIDYGATWNKVTTFPVATTTGAGISFVLFDKSSGAANAATPVIYVGVIQSTNSFYKSTDGGATWTRISLPNTALMPLQAALASNGIMYIAASDGPGPNGVSAGAVYKFNTATSTFTTINPPTGQGGYAGISVDAQNPNLVLVSTIDRWYPGDEIFRSTDGGTSWTAILRSGIIDNTPAPYSSASTPHWTGDVDIDPFNSANAWFITGYGVFNSTNATATTVSTIKWSFKNKGLEETVPLALISPPAGAPLLSAIGDIDGFKHDNLDVSPTTRLLPTNGTNSSIEFAEAQPLKMARTHYNQSAKYGAYSTDGGTSWTAFSSSPTGTGGGGKIALSANGNTIVWAPDNAGAFYSTNNGATWTASTGSPTGFAPIADRVNANKFYIYNAGSGQVYASTNAGVSFSVAATGLPTVPDYQYWMTDLKAVFGSEGDLWLCNPNGLYHSTNSGASFTRLTNVGQARKVALGKAAVGQTYPSIYIVGIINNQYGFYRSDDAGASWSRINDDQHQFGSINFLVADRNTFGRLYLATGGRGIIYGTLSSSLPVTLTTLKGAYVENSGNSLSSLSWQTVTESNNKGFEVQRSLNLSDWTTVAMVASKAVNGNSNTALSYTFSDNVQVFSGKIYYRIRQVDADGKSLLSNIVTIDKNTPLRIVRVQSYPNPLTGNTLTIRLTSPADNTVRIRILGSNGAVSYTSGRSSISAGDNVIPVNVARLAKGMYVVEVSDDNNNIIGTARIVK